jgi:hypothetical protein
MGEVLVQAVELIPGGGDTGLFHLSYSERLMGFGICAGCAILVGVLSIISLFVINLRKFAVLLIVATILFVVGLGLLLGFSRLVRRCKDGRRVLSSVSLPGGILITLLAIGGFLVETVAFLYFALSLIPGPDRLLSLLLHALF